MNEHPKWAIKYVHKSKINAVHIVNWEDHHHIATVPHVYTHNGEDSEGKQAAELIAAAPELLEALQNALILLVIAEDQGIFKDCALPTIGKRYIEKAQRAIEKATS